MPRRMFSLQNRIERWIEADECPSVENIAQICRANLLSPKQTAAVIRRQPDASSLMSAVQDEMNRPDKTFLLNVLRPNIDVGGRNGVTVSQVIAGVTFGDMVGSTREFTKYDFVRAKTDLPLLTDKSFTTDDTVLTEATWKAIIRCPKKPDFYRAYAESYKQYPDAGYGAHFIRWAQSAGKGFKRTTGYHSCANGSAMRVAPVAAYYDSLSDVMEHAYESAVVTHNHVEGVRGAVVMAICIWLVLHGACKQNVLSYCQSVYPDDKVTRLSMVYGSRLFGLSQSIDSQSGEVNDDSLYCVYAVPYVVKCFVESDGLEDCIRTILGTYGDNDTLCAMAGALNAANKANFF